MERAKARRRRVALATLGVLAALGFAVGAVLGSGGSGGSEDPGIPARYFKADAATEVGLKAPAGAAADARRTADPRRTGG